MDRAACVCADGTDTEARLAHLYVCEGLSTYRIAERVGWDRQRVNRALHRRGVPVRPRGAGRSRPAAARDEPAALRPMLEDLYVRRRMTSREIGNLLGLPERRVRTWLRRWGITVRTRGGHHREDRRELDARELAACYIDAGLTATETGRMFGVSRQIVLRQAHDLGLPVRTGGPAALDQTAGEIELIRALYADPLVSAAMRRHEIPRVPPGGSIVERFPRPFPLDGAALRDLYESCGLATAHIEMLTGRPTAAIARMLRRHGIRLRDPGGRSPFRRRYQATIEQRRGR